MNTAWTIRRYSPEQKRLWDDFACRSRNATFLLLRDYMDYHSERFADHSLLAYKGSRLMALLPAHLDGTTLCSHRGLSYGGWILPPAHLDCSDVLDLWNAFLDYCRTQDFSDIDYKPLPAIYASQPSDEDLYALWRCGAEMSECSPSAAIALDANPGLNQLRRRNLNATSELPLEIARCESAADYAAFHAMLAECLAERHAATPVHTLDEMLLLASRFPFDRDRLGNISLWTAKLDGQIHAGAWVFNTPRTLHAQYIATTGRGRELNLLTPLFARLIALAGAGHFGPGKRFFDFGISTEQAGRILNAGLYRQKASFGASAALTSRFRIKLRC